MQQVGDIPGNDIDHAGIQGFFGGQAGALAHCLFGPFRVAPAQFRETADISGGIVYYFFPHGVCIVRDSFSGFLLRSRFAGSIVSVRYAGRGRFFRRVHAGHAAHLYRGGGAKVGARRHGRDMRGIHHVRAGAGRARAGWRYMDGDRDRGGDNGLDDAAHGQVQAARGIEPDDDDFRPGLVCLVKTPFDVIRDCRADSVVHVEQDGLVARLSMKQSRCQRNKQNCK